MCILVEVAVVETRLSQPARSEPGAVHGASWSRVNVNSNAGSVRHAGLGGRGPARLASVGPVTSFGMEFVVLKVNGRDVSPVEGARVLSATDEPLVVTLRRLKVATPPPATPPPATPPPATPPPATPLLATPPPATPPPLASERSTRHAEVQTDDLWPDWRSELENGAPERSLHDILEQDIDLEEVTLRRAEAAEQLGITLSCSCSSGSDDLDTEVYIAAVEPSSVAGRDGRLQRGDQILQVNGEDIMTREAAEQMFNSPGASITLLVSRYYEEDDVDDEEVESCRRPSCGKPSKPRTPTRVKHIHVDRDAADDGSTDRRSDSSTDRRSDGSGSGSAERRAEGRPEATGYVNVQPKASTSEPASARRKESGRQADVGDTSTCPQAAGRKAQRASQGSGARPGARMPPGSLALPLRAPSSEHIYETIPESDSEHIYCEPYEPSSEVANGHPLLTLRLGKEKAGRDDRPTLRLAGPTFGLAPGQQQTNGGSFSTMYTNAANLQHTIEVQQELFRQSLRQTTPTSSSRPPLPLPSPTGRGRASRGAAAPPFPVPPAPSDAKMEWKVKRRADGSRYITRRPVRTRVLREALRDRAAQLRDERAGFSTEDDTASELKMGRYWTKAERKQHVRRRREQHLQHIEQLRQQPSQSNEEDAGRRLVNVIDLSHKKMTRKNDFTTVQELLAQGSKSGSNGKMLGLLSVTTV